MTGTTYADVSKHLYVSESTVKRWFASGKISLERIDDICEFTQIDIHDFHRVIACQSSENAGHTKFRPAPDRGL